jgi:hypothetical protein
MTQDKFPAWETFLAAAQQGGKHPPPPAHSCLLSSWTWVIFPNHTCFFAQCIEMPAITRVLVQYGRVMTRSTAQQPCLSRPLNSGSRTTQRPYFQTSKHSISRQCQQQVRLASSAQKAKDLNQQGIDKELSKFDRDIKEAKDKQERAPWHREGADQAPVSRQRSAGAMTKGSRLQLV